MAHIIRKETAQQIVTSIKSICGCDVNYINEDGIIFASTDEKRLGTIAVYDELDLTLLLASVPGEVRSSFLKKVMSKLDKNDCTLLSAYFEHDASLKKTCDVLYLHKNTLQYRLDRIWKLTGYNPRSFQDAVILYLGLRLK
jgi:sugar diacid utilization regulator